jgi:hypothetical protein
MTLRAVAMTFAGMLALTSSSQAAGPRGSAAHTVNVKDEAKVHLVRSSGSTLYDEGAAHGTIGGTVRIDFTYDGNPEVKATLTISSSIGSIKVEAKGKLSSPTNPAPSFKGTLAVLSGTGRYAHAHGGGALYGVFYRRSYAMVVQVQGKVTY